MLIAAQKRFECGFVLKPHTFSSQKWPFMLHIKKLGDILAYMWTYWHTCIRKVCAYNTHNYVQLSCAVVLELKISWLRVKLLCKQGWEINPPAPRKGLQTSACPLIPEVQHKNQRNLVTNLNNVCRTWSQCMLGGVLSLCVWKHDSRYKTNFTSLKWVLAFQILALVTLGKWATTQVSVLSVGHTQNAWLKRASSLAWLLVGASSMLWMGGWVSESVSEWEMYAFHTNQIESTANSQSNFLL